MDFTKIIRMVSIIATAFSLSPYQEKELENYAKMNMNAWQAELRRYEEIEAYIKNEASRISTGR